MDPRVIGMGGRGVGWGGGGDRVTCLLTRLLAYYGGSKSCICVAWELVIGMVELCHSLARDISTSSVRFSGMK